MESVAKISQKNNWKNWNSVSKLSAHRLLIINLLCPGDQKLSWRLGALQSWTMSSLRHNGVKFFIKSYLNFHKLANSRNVFSNYHTFVQNETEKTNIGKIVFDFKFFLATLCKLMSWLCVWSMKNLLPRPLFQMKNSHVHDSERGLP